jgi:pilus assembly protein CpaC
MVRLKIAVAVVAALAAFVTTTPIQANEPAATVRPTAGSRFLALGIGKSIVVDLPRDTKDVLVADPKIANAVVRSARRAYLIGVAPGQTSVVFFDAEGTQIVSYDIEVGRDASGVRDALRRIVPNANVRVHAINDSVVLSGTVANADEAMQVVDAAAKLVGDAKKVVNGLVIKDKEQILLKVTVAEVQRNVLKQLGVNLNGAIAIGSFAIGTPTNPFIVDNPFTVLNQPIAGTQIPLVGTLPNASGSISATLRAMEQAGVLRTLAEPNLTAISGEPAKFLAGGEFPIPAGVTCDPPGSSNCTLSVQFKQFGVALDFTPIVLSEGRISLRVATEVSELSSEGAIRLSNVTIPALKVRRAHSTVELPSGGSIAMAGLLQETTKQNINGFPGLMNLPVLGALFKSRDYQTGQTELVIIVTPYVVKPVARKELSRPDDGFADPPDPSTVLLGRINRIYGVPGHAKPHRAYYGKYGFIVD